MGSGPSRSWHAASTCRQRQRQVRVAVAIPCLEQGVSDGSEAGAVAARQAQYKAHTEWQRFHVAGMVVVVGGGYHQRTVVAPRVATRWQRGMLHLW